MFKLVLEKAEEPEIKLPTSAGSSKQQNIQKNIYFSFIDYAKAFHYVDHNKLWKIQKEMGIPDHLTSLLRNLYAGQEATVRTGHGSTNWFQLEKGVRQGLSLGLEWKLTFSSPVTTAEFFKFAGILSVTLSQHHLLGFEIAQLNSITSTSFVYSNVS